MASRCGMGCKQLETMDHLLFCCPVSDKGSLRFGIICVRRVLLKRFWTVGKVNVGGRLNRSFGWWSSRRERN